MGGSGLLIAGVLMLCASPAALARGRIAAPAQCKGYSFVHKPFVNPLIVKALETWISDEGEQVVAINLPGSADTNRFFGDFKAKSPGNGVAPDVVHRDADACKNQTCLSGPPFFSYHLVGRTPEGVYVLRTAEGGGGSGVFESLLLVTLDVDEAFDYDSKHHRLAAGRERCLIKRQAQIVLGDRYAGSITLHGSRLRISPDENTNGSWPKTGTVTLTIPAPQP